MSKRRALDRCRRKADDGRARPAMVDEPLDNSAFTVWPSTGRQLPPRSTILDMLCFYASPTVRSDLMQPLAFDESAWLADQLVDRVIELVRTWEPTTEWHSQSLTRSGRALEWIVWRVATGADPDLALYVGSGPSAATTRSHQHHRSEGATDPANPHTSIIARPSPFPNASVA